MNDHLLERRTYLGHKIYTRHQTAVLINSFIYFIHSLRFSSSVTPRNCNRLSRLILSLFIYALRVWNPICKILFPCFCKIFWERCLINHNLNLYFSLCHLLLSFKEGRTTITVCCRTRQGHWQYQHEFDHYSLVIPAFRSSVELSAKSVEAWRDLKETWNARQIMAARNKALFVFNNILKNRTRKSLVKLVWRVAGKYGLWQVGSRSTRWIRERKFSKELKSQSLTM